MKTELTTKQRRILEFIQGYVEENHLPPSFGEIGRHFGVSVGTVQDQVEALRRKGHIKKESMVARGIRLPMSGRQIPVLGRVHAGPFHMAMENVEGYLPADAGLQPSKHFALKVRGDSMIEAGIFENDVVIVRMQAVADEGDIVVARVDDETTVKRLRRRDGQTILEPANPHYRPIENVPFTIVGVVVEVRRKYK